MVNPPPSALWVAIIITQMWCTGAVFCCCLFTSIIITELAEGTTIILFQERCVSFMRVAKRTNKQSIQGMDFAISWSSILWLYGCNVHLSYKFFQLGI
ncbi:unnamed protein product, partial [Sphagnum jensenii]